MGIIQKNGVFKVTTKGKLTTQKPAILSAIMEEFVLLIALVICAIAMIATRGMQNFDAQLWVALLALQSLPYVSALICQLLAQTSDPELANVIEQKPMINA